MIQIGGKPMQKDRSRRTYWPPRHIHFRETLKRPALARVFYAISLFLLAMGACATASIPTKSLKAKRLQVLMDSDYAPYSFISAEGKLQGILIDQWQAWENKTGVGVDIRAMDWATALDTMRSGNFDVIDEIVETSERREDFDFTPAYAAIEVPIFFRTDISGITDLLSLKGFPVGVKQGDQHVDRLKANGVNTIISFRNNAAMIDAARQHKISVFIMDAPAAFYLLHKAGIEDQFRHSEPIFRDGLQRAVRKGNTELLREISTGFGAIEPDELKKIDEKWYGSSIFSIRRYLVYAGYAAGFGIVVIGMLAAWNWTLRRGISQRTAELTESEERFRQIAENVREVYWMGTPEMDHLFYVSPSFENVWGRTVESIRQESSTLTTTIHPEDCAFAVSRFTNARENGFDVEYRIVRPDGNTRWIRNRGFPVKDASGKVYRIAGVAEDITARKKAEAALRQSETDLAEAQRIARVGSWSLDIPLRTLRGSEEFYRIFDFDSSPPLSYASLGQRVHPEDMARFTSVAEEITSSGKPCEVEYRIKTRSGQQKHIRSIGYARKDVTGAVIGRFGIVQDITERKEAEEALKTSYRQLRALSARIQSVREEEAARIAREIHDDLGQKLTGLKMDLARAERKIGALESSSPVNSLLDTIVSAHELVDDLGAAVQKIASNLRPELLDKLGLAAAVEFESRRLQERTGISCEAHVPIEEVKLTSEMSTALYRIFQECLTNVARHAKATRVKTELLIESDAVVLTVQDNGRGFAPAELASAHSLGLLGMKERAALLGGEVIFETHPPNGTIVTARLPFDRSPSTGTHRRVVSRDGGISMTGPTEQTTIFVQGAEPT
jgi:PAS domain S-box-containing protein